MLAIPVLRPTGPAGATRESTQQNAMSYTVRKRAPDQARCRHTPPPPATARHPNGPPGQTAQFEPAERNATHRENTRPRPSPADDPVKTPT
jgi:hypothetical protein